MAVPSQIPHCIFDDGQRISTISDLDLKVDSNTGVGATMLYKSREASFTQSFGANKNSPLGDNPGTAAHFGSPDIRNSAKYTCSIFWIQTSVATQPCHVLGAVNVGNAVRVLFNDKNLLFLQVIEQSNVMRRN